MEATTEIPANDALSSKPKAIGMIKERNTAKLVLKVLAPIFILNESLLSIYLVNPVYYKRAANINKIKCETDIFLQKMTENCIIWLDRRKR